jgi:hypothetical protein
MLKLLHKSSHQARADVLLPETVEHDEIKDYVEGRYISPPEAATRMLGLKMKRRSHTVYRLAIHLPGNHEIIFDPLFGNFKVTE